MPRISPADVALIQNTVTEGNASMDIMFRTMAHRPELAQHAMRLVEAAMRSGTVEPGLKEMLAVRVSQVNHCFY
ncbi:MAG TPA: carboxymuconolactone decarboxylase family protein [Ktedonobacteraceae bacterium]|nr:carboxymuconolactone decarboxylase family protein [Ktedonobacteraceae bacterium]